MTTSHEELIARAERARQIVEDPLFAQAWTGLEQGAVERLAACDTTDTRRLQALTMALQTVRAIRQRFEVWIAEGRDAAERQERKQAAVPLFSRFRR